MEKEYKYDKGDGTMVSRQRMYQLRNPEKTRALQKKFYENNKERLAAKAKAWRDKFQEEHGISYHMWRKENAKAKTD